MEVRLSSDMERLLLQQAPEVSSASKSRLSGPAASSSTSTPQSGGDKPRAGKGSRGPRPRLFSKGQCQADGCTADLHSLPRYNQRNHICLHHKAAETFFKLGAEVRFCQRCGVSHPLSEYDGLKKSCRRMLALHNSRRRKSSGATSATPAASGPADAASPAAPLQAQVQAQQQEQPQPQPQPQQPSAQLLPALAGMQLGAARAGDPSPAASVGSAAALPEDGDNWLLADGGSDGASMALAAALPDPPPPLWEEGGHPGAGGSGAPHVAAVPSAAPHHERICGAPEHECICCDTCRASDGCCGGAAAAGDAAAVGGAGGRAVVGGAAARAGAGVGAAGGVAGGSELAAGPGCRPAHDRLQPEPPAVAGPAAGPLGSPVDDTADSAASPAAVSGREAAGPAPQAGAAANAAAASALAQLQQHNAALYQVFVQQQLLAAQTLLTTAGMVLSQSLPLPQSTSTSSVSAR